MLPTWEQTKIYALSLAQASKHEERSHLRPVLDSGVELVFIIIG
jgi:hypothetical protein